MIADPGAGPAKVKPFFLQCRVRDRSSVRARRRRKPWLLPNGSAHSLRPWQALGILAAYAAVAGATSAGQAPTAAFRRVVAAVAAK